MSSAAPGDHGARSRGWQLPADVSGFVGRAAELARLATLLREARLVTITGPAGVGKSRLALRAAATLQACDDTARDFPDGACLVDLSEITDPGLVQDAITSCLQPRDADPRGPLTQIPCRLRRSRMLLILDTCEHLAGACALFAARLLREAAGVTILATSRQPLHVGGERVLRLGPLPVLAPPTRDWDGVLTGGTGDAAELFTQRAAAALPGFTVTPADLPEVVRICQRLDGLPLAIEQAALRVRALPLALLSQRLEDESAALAGTRRGAVARHRTLRAAIAWSYELCTPAERAVWERLSAITGYFNLTAATTVAACAEVPPGQVGGVLADLVDKSVVLVAGLDRYRLLRPVREYAAERLADAGQLTAPGGPGQPGRNGQAAGNGSAAARATGITVTASMAGRNELTCRELEIALLVASGLSNREIAERLVISRRTVDAHLNHIFGKLGLSSRVQLTLWVRAPDRMPRPATVELSPVTRA